MKIQYCSDLHLEFPVNKKYLKANRIKAEGEILLLAGDIMLMADIDKEKEFFDFLSDSFAHSYWVPGNHEYYRSDIAQRTGSFNESIRRNVTLLNNTAIVYSDVRLLFSTLWSKIDVTKELVIKKSMADFRLIESNGHTINVDEYNLLHADALSFIKREIELNKESKAIVVSHHLPTFFNYPEKYRHSELNTAFATELFDMIEPSDIRYWIFGHSHENVPDFMIGKTTLTTNQLGYVEHGEHRRFVHNKLLSF